MGATEQKSSTADSSNPPSSTTTTPAAEWLPLEVIEGYAVFDAALLNLGQPGSAHAVFWSEREAQGYAQMSSVDRKVRAVQVHGEVCYPGEGPSAQEQEHAGTPGDVEGFGVFDADDLADEAPFLFGWFRTEREAQGYTRFAEWGCVTPEVRPVKLFGMARGPVLESEVQP